MPEMHELLEVASDELRAIVGDDSRLGFQVLLLGSLQDHFDIGFSHSVPNENSVRPASDAIPRRSEKR